MIAESMYDLIEKGSLIRKMFEEGKRLAKIHGAENVYDFSLGNPNAEAPVEIKDTIIKILEEENPRDIHSYMNNAGYEDVRNKIAAYENRTKGINITANDVVMVSGAAAGINIVFKTVLNPGDEIITFAPYFAEYNNYASLYNANLKVVPPDLTTFQPDIQALKDMITEKTKIVLINSPNNPSGVIYSEETIIELCDALREKSKETGVNIVLLSDEPYREIVFDGVKVPYIQNYYDHTIVGYSFSKSLSLAGERIGYLVINPAIEEYNHLMAALTIMNRVMGFVNAPSLFQKVVAENLDLNVDLEFYKRNRDDLYNILTGIGFECVNPQGAFYLFVKSPIEDERVFCEKAKEFNILLVPGRAFGCKGYVRLSYCISHDTIVNSKEAFEKLWDLINRS